MEFYLKLPRNKKEFTLFIAVISILSVNIIAPLVTCFEVGFRMDVWADTLRVIPFIWLCVIALVLITYKPAQWLTHRIIKQEDSFSAHIVAETLCTVLLMSAFMTVIGAWIGTKQISTEPIRLFFYKWPRNFTIAFAAEIFIAQPAARKVMLTLHQMKDRKIKAGKL